MKLEDRGKDLFFFIFPSYSLHLFLFFLLPLPPRLWWQNQLGRWREGVSGVRGGRQSNYLSFGRGRMRQVFSLSLPTIEASLPRLLPPPRLLIVPPPTTSVPPRFHSCLSLASEEWAELCRLLDSGMEPEKKLLGSRFRSKKPLQIFLGTLRSS